MACRKNIPKQSRPLSANGVAKVANKQLVFFFARVSLFQKTLYPLTVTKILKQNESVGTPPLTASHQRCSCTIFKLPDYTAGLTHVLYYYATYTHPPFSIYKYVRLFLSNPF